MSSNNNVSIAPLLKQLISDQKHDPRELAAEIASAISYLFDNNVSTEQCASLLTALRLTRLDEDPYVIAACAQAMRDASKIDETALHQILAVQTRPQGSYRGGVCDIVGTGGDGHSTFNVSTTSSIISSAFLLVAKHGAQASSSKSGSADVLMAIKPLGPIIEAVNPDTLKTVFENGSYAFLFAKQFHPGMKYAAPIRKEIGFRTIFNILGPLANPMHRMMEAGIYGVYKSSLGPVYADALKLCGTKKAMVVCGHEQLDEISCAGKTDCWKLSVKSSAGINGSSTEQQGIIGGEFRHETQVQYFQLQPSDFGLSRHRLDEVLPGRGPEENAELLMKILRNEVPQDDPTLEFVLMNTAALLVISGVCDESLSSMGPGDDGHVISEVGPGDGRWKEGVRRARWAITSGSAARVLDTFIKTTRSLSR